MRNYLSQPRKNPENSICLLHFGILVCSVDDVCRSCIWGQYLKGFLGVSAPSLMDSCLNSAGAVWWALYVTAWLINQLTEVLACFSSYLFLVGLLLWSSFLTKIFEVEVFPSFCLCFSLKDFLVLICAWKLSIYSRWFLLLFYPVFTSIVWIVLLQVFAEARNCKPFL